jgi:hypothetical protein
MLTIPSQCICKGGLSIVVLKFIATLIQKIIFYNKKY